ncbi:MAG: peptide deformylase, partial [Dehalococcoidia bacterium]
EDNLLAEALEHEIDHINGMLYIDHLESMDDLVRLDEDGDEQPDEDHDDAPSERPAPPRRTREVKARPARARS